MRLNFRLLRLGQTTKGISMKAFVLALLLSLSVSSYAQEACNPTAKYDCTVLVDGNVISLEITDRSDGKKEVLLERICDYNTQYCKADTVHYLSVKINDLKANGFCY